MTAENFELHADVDPKPQVVTLDWVANDMSVSRKTVTREADAGNLRTIKVRGRRLVLRKDYQTYLAGLSGNGEHRSQQQQQDPAGMPTARRQRQSRDAVGVASPQ